MLSNQIRCKLVPVGSQLGSFLQCLDTLGWFGDMKGIWPVKKSVPFISEGSVANQVEEAVQGGPANPGSCGTEFSNHFPTIPKECCLFNAALLKDKYLTVISENALS